MYKRVYLRVETTVDLVHLVCKEHTFFVYEGGMSACLCVSQRERVRCLAYVWCGYVWVRVYVCEGVRMYKKALRHTEVLHESSVGAAALELHVVAGELPEHTVRTPL